MNGARPALALILAASTTVACQGGRRSGAERLGGPRFDNAGIVWEVADDLDVPEPPSESGYHWKRYYFDGFVTRPIRHTIAGKPRGRARGTNALDEVPDSTWFTNRIGRNPGAVDPVAIRRGPGDGDTPETRVPWKVAGAKTAGVTTGFVIEDAGGVRWMLKLEVKGYPEMETAADAVVSRLLWAAGYNVPHDVVVYFRAEDLVDAPEGLLDQVEGPDATGSFRATASRFVEGEPLGPIPPAGVRAGDRNDLVPHERRRELRGAYPLFAWLHHVDVKPDNTLDTWVAAPDDPTRHFVKHYLIDFGKSLGTLSIISQQPSSGFAHVYHGAARSAVPLVDKPWTKLVRPPFLGVGLYEAVVFHPARFRTNVPYAPFEAMDRFDGYWGARIVMSFRREHISAALAAGRYSDPRTVEYLLATIEERQKLTGRYWFEQVAPLDRFEVNGDQLCFVDLLLFHGLATETRPTSYYARAFAHDGTALGWQVNAEPGEDARACIHPVPHGPDHDGYTIVELVVRRSERIMPPVLVHLAEDPATRALRVIGVHRE